MPKYIVKSIVQALKRTSKNVETSKVAILGTAYKGNVDDARQSPAEPIINGLKRLNAQTVAYDPICNESFGAKRANSLYEAVTGADCFVIVTDHMAFKDLNLQEIKTLMNERPVIIDGRRIVNPREAEGLGFIYYGIGYGVMR
jgi:UDP-N-acetyl-D-mannosaminuronic acid dehydrogenase